MPVVKDFIPFMADQAVVVLLAREQTCSVEERCLNLRSNMPGGTLQIVIVV